MPKGSKAALWNLAFYTGVRRGDVPTLYVFAQMQLTRFRPARGVPVVFALRGFAGKPSTTFFRQFHCRKHCFRRTQLYCSDCGEFVGT